MSGVTLVAGTRVTTGVRASAALTLDATTSLRLASQTSVVLREQGRVEVDRGSIYVDRGRDRDPAAPARREPLEVVTRFAVITDIGVPLFIRSGGRVAILEIADRQLRLRFTEGEPTQAERDAMGPAIERALAEMERLPPRQTPAQATP